MNLLLALSAILFLFLGCASKLNLSPEDPTAIIGATSFLTKHIDQNIDLVCNQEAVDLFLMLRTIRPRYDQALADLKKMSSTEKFKHCHQSCSCQWVNEAEGGLHATQKSSDDQEECWKRYLAFFCQSSIYQKLKQESNDF